MTTPTTVKVQLKLRQDTSSGWSAVNPILLAGELGRESNTGKIKIGDGSTAWNSLAYQPFGALITNADISATAEIAVSKLADGAARQLLQTDTAGTGVEWTSNVDVPGTLDVTGAATFDAAVTIDGNSTAASFIPTGSTVPTNGVYLSAANNVSIATNSTERLRIDAAGQIEAVSLGSAAAPTFSWTGDPNTGIYSPGADQVAISTNGTGRLFVDANGYVDVASTSSSLSIVSLNATTTGNASLRFSDTTANVGNINYNFTDDAMTFRVNASERLRIDSSGRLGLGTSSPAALWHLRSDANSAVTHLYLQNRNAGASAQSRIAFTDSANDLSDNRHAYIGAVTTGAGQNGNSFVIATNPNGGSAQERVWVSSTGNVGIGTTSPATTLSVNGGFAITSGTFPSSGSGLESWFDGTTVFIQGYNRTGSSWLPVGINGSQLVFGASGSEAFRVDSSRRLLVGTSSDSGGALLQVNGDRVRIATAKTPASASATGTAGEICWDANYVYVCTATNTWKRSAISTW